MSNTPELIADLGLAITKVLEEHGIRDKQVKIRVDESEIRMLVKLEDEE